MQEVAGKTNKIQESDLVKKQREMLVSLGNRALALSGDIGKGGRPLDKSERELLRLAMMPILQESLEEALISYGLGIANDKITDRILAAFDELR